MGDEKKVKEKTDESLPALQPVDKIEMSANVLAMGDKEAFTKEFTTAEENLIDQIKKMFEKTKVKKEGMFGFMSGSSKLNIDSVKKLVDNLKSSMKDAIDEHKKDVFSKRRKVIDTTVADLKSKIDQVNEEMKKSLDENEENMKKELANLLKQRSEAIKASMTKSTSELNKTVTSINDKIKSLKEEHDKTVKSIENTQKEEEKKINSDAKTEIGKIKENYSGEADAEIKNWMSSYKGKVTITSVSDSKLAYKYTNNKNKEVKG